MYDRNAEAPRVDPNSAGFMLLEATMAAARSGQKGAIGPFTHMAVTEAVIARNHMQHSL